VRCPLTGHILVHGSKDSTFEYCHFVPKHLQKKVPIPGFKLDDNAGNFFPTTSLMSRNIELHQSIPNLSFKFHSPFDSTYDRYLVQICRDLPLDHPLRRETGVTKESSEVYVYMPKICRPYLELHLRVFCTHHGLNVMPGVFPMGFDKLLSEALYSHIMLSSPFVAKAKKSFCKSKSSSAFEAPKLGEVSSKYPQRQLTKKQAKALVKTDIELSSAMFPKWAVEEHYMRVYVVAYNASKRVFEFVFPDDYEDAELEHFKAEYKGSPEGFKVKVYKNQTEAMIINFGPPDFVKRLEFESPRTKRKQREESQHSPTTASGKKRSTAVAQAPSEAHPCAAVAEEPSGFRVSRRIMILWSESWKEGTICTADGTTVTVKYDDGDEESHNLCSTKVAYKLIAEPLEEAASQEDQWRCIGCDVWHSSLDGPKTKVCCSKCKLPVSSAGLLFSEQRRVRVRVA
jgi:hypothetical protein